MRKNKHAPCKLRWLFIWLIQFASMLAFSILISLGEWLGGIPAGICIWGIAPAAGFISACLATRKGLLNYAAWIAPPAMLFAGYWIAWGYPIGPGPALVNAFVSLVGAATGEVMKNRGVR